VNIFHHGVGGGGGGVEMLGGHIGGGGGSGDRTGCGKTKPKSILTRKSTCAPSRQ
jgi:hypothetical protein